MMPCLNCESLPRVRVRHVDHDDRLPRTWRPIDEHPELRPGPWVPCGEMKGVVFCEECQTLWYLFLDPGQYYYTDVIQLAPELVAVLSEDASLEDVLPVAVFGDALLQLMIRDWFALAEYDPSAAVEALVQEIAAPGLPTRRAVRLLDFLAAVVAGLGRGRSVTIQDASPIVDLLTRGDLVALDAERQASEMNEIRRLVAGIARAGFGRAFGADHDRIHASEATRERLLAVARVGRLEPRAPVLAPAGVRPQQRVLEGIEQLVCEIEQLVREGAGRVTSQEIAPVIEVVRRFWAIGADGPSDTPCWDPGLDLYRRCRDLLLALRHAKLIPSESREQVAAALAVTASQPA